MIRLLAAWLMVVPCVAWGDEPVHPSARERYVALEKEYQAAETTWSKTVPTPAPAQGDPFWIRHYQASPDWEFARRFIEFAEANPTDPAAAEAALMILQMNLSARDAVVFPLYLRAGDLITRHHLEEENVLRLVVGRPTLFIVGNLEPYYRALLARSLNRDTQARACMGLIRCLTVRIRMARTKGLFDGAKDRPDMIERDRFMNSRLAPGLLAYAEATDVPASQQEVGDLLDRIVREYGDIPFASPWASERLKTLAKGRSLADEARGMIHQREDLRPGKPAPEITGQDLDGKPLKLSDYRGKVVVLVFWGAWCGPCMRSIPMEQALVERLKDRPFALLGINSDADREQARAVVAREGVNWRSWFDGGRVDGPIAEEWHVRGWPTIIVLDRAGVIRYTGLPHHVPSPLNDAVDSLLAEPIP